MAEKFRETLYDRINVVQATGSFAVGNVLDSAPNPGIHVDGEGPIALPLSKEAARNLASKSDQAPFGYKGETRVDEAVRKAFQMDADRISFKNKMWSEFVNGLAERVARELGVPPASCGTDRRSMGFEGTNGIVSAPDRPNVKAQLYKHLLYEPGSMFKPHKE